MRTYADCSYMLSKLDMYHNVERTGRGKPKLGCDIMGGDYGSRISNAWVKSIICGNGEN